MKFIVCPFCKTRIVTDSFPRGRRTNGHVVMHCPSCKHRLAFTIREEEAREDKTETHSNSAQNKNKEVAASLQVIENVFGYAASFNLTEGLNRVGRYNNKYSELEIPIHTADPSMDRTHCLIVVEKDLASSYTVTIMDNDSMTGTFINSRELLPGEKHQLKDGDVITLGATSILFVENNV